MTEAGREPVSMPGKWLGYIHKPRVIYFGIKTGIVKSIQGFPCDAGQKMPVQGADGISGLHYQHG